VTIESSKVQAGNSIVTVSIKRRVWLDVYGFAENLKALVKALKILAADVFVEFWKAVIVRAV